MNKFNIDVDTTKDEYVVTMRFKCNNKRHDWEGVETCETYSEITGILNTETGEFGFAKTIDMDYKGKPDQYTEQIIRLEQVIDETDFIKICEDWSIPLVIE